MCRRVVIIVDLDVAVDRKVLLNGALRRRLSIQRILILYQEQLPLFVWLVTEVSSLSVFQSGSLPVMIDWLDRQRIHGLTHQVYFLGIISDSPIVSGSQTFDLFLLLITAMGVTLDCHGYQVLNWWGVVLWDWYVPAVYLLLGHCLIFRLGLDTSSRSCDHRRPCWLLSWDLSVVSIPKLFVLKPLWRSVFVHHRLITLGSSPAASLCPPRSNDLPGIWEHSISPGRRGSALHDLGCII